VAQFKQFLIGFKNSNGIFQFKIFPSFDQSKTDLPELKKLK
jgi:hypothetical protein